MFEENLTLYITLTVNKPANLKQIYRRAVSHKNICITYNSNIVESNTKNSKIYFHRRIKIVKRYRGI